MDEILRQAVITMRGMWVYRWLGLAVATVVALIAGVVVSLIPDKYEASTRIYVNTASILKPLMKDITVQPNDDQQIAMLSRMVVSRPNVQKLIQAVGLDAKVKSKVEYEKLIDDVIKALRISAAGRDNLYTLAYRDVEPQRAKRVVELFSAMFIESGHGSKATDTDAAKKFIDEQISLYEKKLQEAENRLKEFKLRSLGMVSGEGRDYFARLAETNNLLERAQLDLREAENTRDAFRRGLAAEEQVAVAVTAAPGARPMASTNIAEIEARLDAMRRNLDILLQRYTENHPDVQGVQRVIRDLEDQRSQLAAARAREGTAAPIPYSTGPRASEQLKVSLAAAEASVSSLRARVAEYQNRYARLKASATMVPQLEAEFAQLNRDYEVNKRNYETLVARRESASMSGEMQSVSGVADFRLIDPPRVSPGPVAPNRMLLFPLAFVLALAAGVASTFVAREVRPSFYDSRALAEATGLPILGTVSMVASPAHRKRARRSAWTFAGGLGALTAAYGACFATIMLLTARSV